MNMEFKDRPVNFGHLLTAGSLVGALSLWSIGMAHNAESVAYKAMVKAASARPDPYTSYNASEDMQRHQKEHDAQLALIREEFARKIETLPRPPKDVVNLLNDLSQRITTVEHLIEACIDYDDRIKVHERNSAMTIPKLKGMGR